MMIRRGIILLFMVSAIMACKKKEEKINDNIVPRDFLSSTDYRSLVIDLIFIEGSGPNNTAVTNMKNFLEARLNKPDGITVSMRAIPSPANFTYSIEDIRSIESDHRKLYSKDEKLAAYVFYADSDYNESSESSKVLGVQYGPTSVAIFKSSIQDFSGGLGEVSEEKLETTVLKHEFGHILGLVNVGTPMVNDHQDPGHGGHCDNPDCLMYYAVEGSDFAELLFGEEIPELDDQCISDLQANGGK